MGAPRKNNSTRSDTKALNSSSTLESLRELKPKVIDYSKAKEQWDRDTKNMTLSQKFVHAMKIMDLPHWK